MTQFIDSMFGVLATLFDKIPFLAKLKGYRAVLGLVGMAVVEALRMKGVIHDPTVLSSLNVGLMAWTGLALNAKGRE